MCEKNILSSVNSDDNQIPNWVIICYGNILRSQVLEQFLRCYSKLWNIDINLYSASVAAPEEFPNKEELFAEIHQELNKRNIVHSLHRNPWSKEVEEHLADADNIIFADNTVKSTALNRMGNGINKEKVFTFYEFISEGEKDFEDTYDYELNRQDPIRFKNAFDELDRIAQKMLLPVKGKTNNFHEN